MKVKFGCDILELNAKLEEVVELPNNTPISKMDEIMRAWLMNRVELWCIKESEGPVLQNRGAENMRLIDTVVQK